MDGEGRQGGKRDGIAGTPPREYTYSMIYVSVGVGVLADDLR